VGEGGGLAYSGVRAKSIIYGINDDHKNNTCVQCQILYVVLVVAGESQNDYFACLGM